MSGELLSVLNLGVRFGGFSALEQVTFDLHAGETVGLVGESGAGKSTLARAILRLVPIASGRVVFCGEDLASLGGAALRLRRRDLQIVFQDPLASLNPRLRVADALSEPLKIHEPALSGRDRQARIAGMLERVGLPADVARRYPHEVSGGQCQRIAIARAMILRPKLLVCDEPVSSLDASIQGQIVNLLGSLQRELGTALLFISHNLAVVRHLSHRVLVMYRGRLVETADCGALFAAPAHPYTRALLAAVPNLTRERPGPAPAMAGDRPAPVPSLTGERPGPVPTATSDRPALVPSLISGRPAPMTSPTRDRSAPVFNQEESAVAADFPGCAYHGRCGHGVPACTKSVPPRDEVAQGHFAACHRWREVVYS